MIKFRVFHDRKNFFGEVSYSFEEESAWYDGTETEKVRDALKKCFSGFGKKTNYCFRIESEQLDGELYVVERHYLDEQNGTYTVTHRLNRNSINNPVTMSASAIRKAVIDLLERSEQKRNESGAA